MFDNFGYKRNVKKWRGKNFHLKNKQLNMPKKTLFLIK